MPTEEILMSNQVLNSKTSSNQNFASITSIINSTAHHELMNGVTKVVEVPVQDTRTKALIYKLTTELKRLSTKYPQILK